MEKIKIRDTEVFKQVAKVIGEKNAEIELFKASKSWSSVDINRVRKGYELSGAFNWGRTDQGGTFWFHIHQGNSPYNGGSYRRG
ncbi:hypothetical protein KUA24_87 [Vibrio phage HNL01]|nr:hypothetical protein KUA24_87 [Vibrio phage HNL01]